MVLCVTMSAEDFRPAWWLPGGHAQTIVPALLRAPEPPGPGEARLVAVTPGTIVRVDIDRPEHATPRGTLLIIHGLGGSSRSVVVLRTAEQARAAGWVCARLNLRGCGESAELARSLYNALQSSDVGLVLDDLERYGLPRPFAVTGYSLGANLALRYAALTGDGCLADGVAAMNPPLDMERTMRAIERPTNAIYERYFVREVCRQLERVRAVYPVPGPPARYREFRSLRRFDHLVTAPEAGLPSAEAYYERASAGPLLGRIRRPTLVLSAADDPFVPIDMFPEFHRAASPAVTFLHPRSGGHMGYWQRGRPRFWAAVAALAFLGRYCPVYQDPGVATGV